MSLADDLLVQWEPKVHAMLRGRSLDADTYDDLAQQLRECVLHAHAAYNKSHQSGASFHTYLHTVMRNHIWKHYLSSKKNLDVIPWDATGDVVDRSDIESENHAHLLSLIRSAKLAPNELIVLDLLLCGYTKTEVTQLCRGPVPAIIRSLKGKFIFLREAYNTSKE